MFPISLTPVARQRAEARPLPLKFRRLLLKANFVWERRKDSVAAKLEVVDDEIEFLCRNRASAGCTILAPGSSGTAPVPAPARQEVLRCFDVTFKTSDGNTDVTV